MRFFLAWVIICGLFAVSTASLLAQDLRSGSSSNGQVNEALENLTPVRFVPDSPLYLLIRTKEVISRFLTSSARDRAKFDYANSSKRLKEAYLMTNKGNLIDASSSLKDYVKSLQDAEKQLEKARGQNQDVVPVADKIIDNLRFQEILIVELSMRLEGSEMENTIGAFKKCVTFLESFKPGISARYRLMDESKINSPSPTPTSVLGPSPALGSKSTISPKRIIY